MPELSRFLGIVIAMYYRDHGPAHFHAIYGDSEITVEIESGRVNGSFPRRALAHVHEWRDLHRAELLHAWSLARESRALPRIGSAGVIHMLPHIVEARYVTGYTVWLRFSDGAEGEVELTNELHGPIFEPLRNVQVFQQLTVHPELKTLVWPNGADFAPEFLRSALRIAA